MSVAIAKYADHLPRERQVRVIRRQGLIVDSQTLWDQINALARHLQPAHDALRAYVLEQPCIGADVLAPFKEGNGENKRWQTWAIAAPNAVSYRILDSRSAAAAADVLGNYSGTLLCDGYSAYESLKKRGGRFEIAHCWAHVRRKFVEAAEIAPAPANQALDLIGQLYAAEADCRSDDDRARIRADRSRAIVRDIQEWALKQEGPPRGPLLKAIAYNGRPLAGIAPLPGRHTSAARQQCHRAPPAPARERRCSRRGDRAGGGREPGRRRAAPEAQHLVTDHHLERSVRRRRADHTIAETERQRSAGLLGLRYDVRPVLRR